MKAHIRPQEARREIGKTALCAGFAPERLAVLSAVLGEQGIRPRPVAADELGQTVGALAGLDAPFAVPAKATHTGAECLVLCGLGNDDLNALLDALREAGLKIPYKAMLTPHNRAWTLDHLIGQLADEHEQLARAAAQKKEGAAGC